MVDRIDSQDVKALSVVELFEKLESARCGRTAAEAQKRLVQFGRNALNEDKSRPLLKLLSYF